MENMYASTLTAKGQTTIPREIREYLNLTAEDKIVYIPDGDKVYLRLLRGTILDIKGTLKHKVNKAIDFHALREAVKGKVAEDTLKDLK